MWEYQARVENVHDGDTIRFLIDQGMYNRTSQWIRFLRVYAPELDASGGEETRQFVVEWTDHHALHENPLEWPFIITTAKDAKSYNRFLGLIRCATCGEMLNGAVNKFLGK